MSFDVWLALVALFGIGGLTPGPAVMLVLASSFQHGFKPAMLASLGIASANVVWLLLAASGAAALAMEFPQAFMGLKIVGLLVILYLALRTIFGPLPNIDKASQKTYTSGELEKAFGDGRETMAPKRSQRLAAKLYATGLGLQLSSPMPLVYFGLLLPAYFDATRPIPPQFFIMLLTVTVTELVGLAVYAYGAERIRDWMHSPRAARLFNITIGTVMIGSGFWAVLSTS